MTRIGLISDTHGYLDDAVFKHFEECDEVWHAGDFGDISVAEKLAAFKPFKGVYGNIDGQDIRAVYPEQLKFTCEQVSIWMIHIGGYPGKYDPKIRTEIYQNHIS
jgi:putative phosphoesterase